MKQIKNRIFTVLAVSAGTLSLYSCSKDFLKQDDTRRLTVTYFDTPAGLRDLADGLPIAFYLQSTTEQISYTPFVRGTDEFTVGSDDANAAWNDYDTRFQSTVLSSSNGSQPYDLWRSSYIMLSAVNTVIAKAPTVLAGDADLTNILAEARFIRAWIYFILLQQWGDIPLVTEPTVGLVTEFPRMPKADVLTQVIDDFKYAYDNLSNPTSYSHASGQLGHVYKDAAAHYLAKALIYRQSEINENNFASTKDADLAEALRLCREVIANRPLAPKFIDLFNYNGPDGPEEELPEVLLAAQYSSQASNSNPDRPDNAMSLFWASWYSNAAWAGMIRNQAGNREYARLRTTDYAMDVYDRVNDSRFWNSFLTTHAVNSPTKRPAGFGARVLTLGQVGVAYIINNADEADRFQLPEGSGIAANGVTPPFILVSNDHGISYDSIRSGMLHPTGPGVGNVIPNVLPRYRVMKENPSGDTYAYHKSWATSVWPPLIKYIDGAMPDLNSPGGQRDIIKARVGETYLLGAEALIRQGQYGQALTEFINPLRARAQYKADDIRSKQIHGGQAYAGTTATPTSFSPVNTYYISNDIAFGSLDNKASDLLNVTDITSISGLPAEDQAIVSKLEYTAPYDIAMCFLLNERSRELMGEFQRWEDLARTKTLVKRAYAYNDGVQAANTLAEYHLLRPIPQEYLDMVTQDGKTLNNDQKAARQNPGYN
jgi:hypothetical protein